MGSTSIEKQERKVKEKRSELRAALLRLGLPEEISRSALARELRQPSTALKMQWPLRHGARLPIEEAALQGWRAGGPRAGSPLTELEPLVSAVNRAETAAVRTRAREATAAFPERLQGTLRRRLRGERSPLERVNNALVEQLYQQKRQGGELCSRGDARRLPLFRACALGERAEARRIFKWLRRSAWAEERRPTWARYTLSQSTQVHRRVGTERDPRSALFEGTQSRLAFCGNLIGCAEAELLFIAEGSAPALVLAQLALVLRVWRPWVIVFLVEDEARARAWQREILLGVRALIDDDLAAIKLWHLEWSARAQRTLDPLLWSLALERGAAAWRRELLFIDAMVPTPPGQLKIYGEPAASEGCWLGQSAVTQGLYTLVMGKHPYAFKGATRPAEMLSWQEAVRFCNRLSALAGLSPAYDRDDNDAQLIEGAEGFRLPSAAEWEIAARSGARHRYAGSDALEEVGWCALNSGRESRPVGGLRANGSGCYDLSGNVAEWCADDAIFLGAYRPGATERVSRGGHWASREAGCAVSMQSRSVPHHRFSMIGLRLCLPLRP